MQRLAIIFITNSFYILRHFTSCSYNNVYGYCYFDEYDQKTWLDIVTFVNQARNLSSLTLQRNICSIHSADCGEIIKTFYSILPYHIKHLKISIYNTKEINMILDQCKNLSTITFNKNSIRCYNLINKWFIENMAESTYQHIEDGFFVWLGKRKLI